MIRLTTPTNGDSITHYVSPQNIARITEAGTSSKWHGIRAYVHTFDGAVLECSEDVAHINHMIADGITGEKK